jgi:ComF family protein
MGAPHSLRSVAEVFASTLLDFLYPPFCLACGSSMVGGREQLCRSCWEDIEHVTKQHPLYQETRGKLTASGISDLCSAFIFQKEGPLQKVLHALKYDGNTAAGIELGRAFGSVLVDWNIHADYLLPVPLHRRKERERGYNQAAYIARGAADVTNLPIRTDLLVRTKNTQTQTQLNREQRKKNMEDAFVIVEQKAHEIEGKTLLIVDDVITTGATIVSCAAALCTANAAAVIAGSVALAE